MRGALAELLHRALRDCCAVATEAESPQIVAPHPAGDTALSAASNVLNTASGICEHQQRVRCSRALGPFLAAAVPVNVVTTRHFRRRHLITGSAQQ
jgi:hypothetical protein